MDKQKRNKRPFFRNDNGQKRTNQPQDMSGGVPQRALQGQNAPSLPTMEGGTPPMNGIRPGNEQMRASSMGLEAAIPDPDEMSADMAGGVNPMPGGVVEPMPIGSVGKIGTEDIRRAEGLLQRYKSGKANLEKRIVDNEQWFKIRHWEQIGKSRNPGDPEPASGWLLNCILNKHADAMDNYPAPNVLPREPSDEQSARALSAVLPAVLEECQYEQTYSDMWWYKLKTGTGVTGVFFDPSKQNGLGDIDIRQLDLLNLFWEPGVKDIQKSPNLFTVDLCDRQDMEARYPHLKDKLNGGTIETTKYRYDDTVETTDKIAVVDWYYKRGSAEGKTLLHYCKFCGGEVLYASENDPEYAQRGFYDHGLYPVVFDTLFPEEGTPAGFGYLDVCKSPQMYIDKLDQSIIKHAVMGARQRFWVREDGSVNEEEYADMHKDFVHFTGNANPNESIVPIQMPSMDGNYVQIKQLKIDELKETSGNRDFQQGGTSSGITAASAISALQEAGSKASRDMIKSSYRAFVKVCYLCIELMRQFYTEDRYYRVSGENGAEYQQFSGQQIAPQPQQGDFGLDMGMRLPVFDIKISPQKASPFSTVAQNERAKELYGMGFFRPDMADQALACMEMMQFDDIEKVRQTIRKNGTMFEQLQQMQQLAMAMAQQLDAMQGSAYSQQVAMILQKTNAGMTQTPSGAKGGDMSVNALGDAYSKSKQQTAAAARNDAATKATPKA